MSADAVLKFILPVIGLLTAVVGPAAWIVREIFKYLIARIGVLEGREATLLAGLVEGAERQGDELATQGAMIRDLAKAAEREAWERNRGGRP